MDSDWPLARPLAAMRSGHNMNIYRFSVRFLAAALLSAHGSGPKHCPYMLSGMGAHCKLLICAHEGLLYTGLRLLP